MSPLLLGLALGASLHAAPVAATALDPASADLARRIEADRQPDARLAGIAGGPGSREPGAWLTPMRFDERDRPVYYRTTNAVAAATIGVDELHPGGASGYGLDGAGFDWIGQWDSGAPMTQHQEFGGRITLRDNPPGVSRHATHVSGTLIAAGLVPAARGMASAATLKYWDWSSDEIEVLYAAHDGLLVSNHSYTSTVGWQSDLGSWYWFGDPAISETEDAGFGHYGSTCQYLDEVAWLKPYWLQVRSAGNDRIDVGPVPGAEHFILVGGQWIVSTVVRDPDGGVDGYDTLPPEATMKNCLVIGAVQDLPQGAGSPSDIELTSYSSFGPTDDGRIKPDLVSNGSGLYSAFETSTDAYGSMGGTSMAAPTASGAVALLQQLYIQGHPDPAATRGGRAALASSIRAALLHTAAEAGSAPGPDYRHGWGLLDARRAADLIADENATRRRLVEGTRVNGQIDTLRFVTDGGPVRLTLAWTDRPVSPLPLALDDPTPRLVNDLDMTLLPETLPPMLAWALDPAAPTAPATATGNHRDNVERIDATLNPGSFSLVLGHSGTLLQVQRWSLTWDNARPLAQLEALADREQVLPGDTLTVELRLAGAFGLSGALLDLDWSPGAFQLQEFLPGPLLSRSGVDPVTTTVEENTFSGLRVRLQRDNDPRGLDLAEGLLGTVKLTVQTSGECAIDFSGVRLLSAAGEDGHDLLRPGLHFNAGGTPEDLEVTFSDEGLFTAGDENEVDLRLSPTPDLGRLRLELPLADLDLGRVEPRERFQSAFDWHFEDGRLNLDWTDLDGLALPVGESFCSLFLERSEPGQSWLRARGSAETSDGRTIRVLSAAKRIEWRPRVLALPMGLTPVADASQVAGPVLFRWTAPADLGPPPDAEALLVSRKADLSDADTLFVEGDSLRHSLDGGDWWWTVLVRLDDGPAWGSLPSPLHLLTTAAQEPTPSVTATDASSVGAVPTTAEPLAAWPNPFNPSTTLAFDLPEAGDARLVVVDLLGREVARLLEGPRAAGSVRVAWTPDAKLASGLYFAVLETPRGLRIRKLHLLR